MGVTLFKALFTPDTNPGFPAAQVGTWAYAVDPLYVSGGLARLKPGGVNGAAVGTIPSAGDIHGATYIGATPANAGLDLIQILICADFVGLNWYQITVRDTAVLIQKVTGGASVTVVSAATVYAPGDQLAFDYTYATGALVVYKNGVAVTPPAADTAYRDNLSQGLFFVGLTGALQTSYVLTRGPVYSEFQQEYIDLLIKQYWEKAKAPAEVAARAGIDERIRDFFKGLITQLDLDVATGHRLDIIGKVVGLSRTSSVPVPVSMQGATPSQMSDTAYRAMLKVKIAHNASSGTLASDLRASIQYVVQLAFGGLAFVDDNYNMSLTLTVDPALDLDLVNYALTADLLPRPQGVSYIVVQAAAHPFGFSDNVNALGFSDKDVGTPVGGPLAEKEIF